MGSRSRTARAWSSKRGVATAGPSTQTSAWPSTAAILAFATGSSIVSMTGLSVAWALWWSPEVYWA